MRSLTYIGHGTTLLRLGEVSILTDPMLGNWLGPLHRQGPPPPPGLTEIPDAVLLSHLHRDHLDVRSLRRLAAGTPLIVPRGATRWAGRGGAEQVREITVGEMVSLGEVEITGVHAAHDGHRDGHWGPEIQPLGYLIRHSDRVV